MKVLGISGLFHDAAAALVVDGRVICAAQEERFTRKKHDPALPQEAAAWCLAEAGLTPADLDHVVFYEKPLKKFDRILRQHLSTFPQGLTSFTQSMRTWLSSRLWLKRDLLSTFSVREDQLLFCEHHLSHAASAFFTSGAPSAAVLTVDGVGEDTTCAIHHARNTEDGAVVFDELRSLSFPHSLGLLYSALTAYLGFAVNEGEYKVMGLAALGTPRFLPAIERLAHLDDDGALTLDLDYFLFHRHPQKSCHEPRMTALFGVGPKPPAAAWDFDDPTHQAYADIAASLQAFTETCLLRWAHLAHALTGETTLCLAGGVALNCVANRRLAEETPFSDVVVHPAAGDAGGAVGAALYVSHALAALPRQKMPSPYLGPAADRADLHQFLTDCRVTHTRFDDDQDLFDEVADRLCQGEVGGFFSGRAEWGPRALGARSIIADPRDAAVQTRINDKVKFRERFRPFAPSIRAADADAYFDIPANAKSMAQTMNIAVAAKDRAKQSLPAVVHENGQSRVHVVDAEAAPRFAGLLDAFAARTGVGCLLNTSMNLHDEPIVNTHAEAYGMFVRSDLDFLVLEDCLVEHRGRSRP